MWITYKNIKFSYKSKKELNKFPLLRKFDELLGLPNKNECLIIKNEKGNVFDGTLFDNKLTESIAKLSKIKFGNGVAYCTDEEFKKAIDKFLKS